MSKGLHVWTTAVLLAGLAWLAPSVLAYADEYVSMDGATILVSPDASLRVRNAADLIRDEVEARSRLRWPIQTALPGGGSPVIVLGTTEGIGSVALPVGLNAANAQALGEEGYDVRLNTVSGRTVVTVVGNSDRGVIFGAGRLLRELRLRRDEALLPAVLAVSSAPHTARRGHQIGFRPKVNTYDGWTPPMFEQYLRDLVVFGANSIELIPPRSDDDADSPHFPLPQLEMMTEMSRLCDAYDVDVWVWNPALDRDYGDAATVENALKEWGAVFKELPRIDVVFVPGGDPGHTKPDLLMALLEKEADVLHQTHPDAEMWMSPQGFSLEWMNEFLAYMNEVQPAWLGGVVFAPQNRISLPDMREKIPAQYPIRHYPDITHMYSCQYPVQDWDVAYKLVQDREVINPRPRAYADIYRWSEPYCDGGFITYSEGVNDDFNKTLWSMLGWDPDTDPHQIAREYARYFIGPDFEFGFAEALFSLERNWTGPLMANDSVETTLLQVQDLERAATPWVLANWRFQQIVYRANYDAYIRRRLIHETHLEKEAMAVLQRADQIGAERALDEAERILLQAVFQPVAEDLRGRASDMAEALYQSIRMQLTVTRHRGISIGRGANFDLSARPLNNLPWLATKFTELREMKSEDDRLKGIHEIVNWTNPGPGGFYDNLGDPMNQPHLVRDVTTEFDPENRTNPLLGFKGSPLDRRVSWFVDAETRFEAPLFMKYDNLDPEAEYLVRAVYAGDKWDTQMRLYADDIQVHDFMDKPMPIAPVEFDIPKAATADGALTLKWDQTPGRGSSGRGTQIAEVWLIRKGGEE
ncbi:MAG: hypothetical protein KJ052_07835 [Candidatus Hydrogenedentes bacterium]|nr:hypothetical protein [Candidatus Hydrogenedentota bacterium]